MTVLRPYQTIVEVGAARMRPFGDRISMQHSVKRMSPGQA
jgi:hypothetical protein